MDCQKSRRVRVARSPRLARAARVSQSTPLEGALSTRELRNGVAAWIAARDRGGVPPSRAARKGRETCGRCEARTLQPPAFDMLARIRNHSPAIAFATGCALIVLASLVHITMAIAGDV